MKKALLVPITTIKQFRDLKKKTRRKTCLTLSRMRKSRALELCSHDVCELRSLCQSELNMGNFSLKYERRNDVEHTLVGNDVIIVS